jgi:hypothetical protein
MLMLNLFSRMSEEVNLESINDNFPNVHLFNVEIILVEYANVIYYLTTSTFLHDYIDKQKQRLAHKALPYMLIADVLYEKGKDGILTLKGLGGDPNFPNYQKVL